ncbi:hypothetical protein K505DRAFT_361048 [Melanomma pulvis-pyrius CBS 109.77]|uniref:F-box domain-containing protein n=1 Tax=Melanomma pulvis-pyrius CBS 109.77 TaxID=1314802 RepID=A0A6A6XEE2_9PLEO|nr:hypothetical protein K505DRAFT_361048 [Melanomma pulvis-pyrius CBS 109.77]
MVRFENLPDELLLEVARNVSPKDLCAFAIVRKSLTPIARDILYESPSIVTGNPGVRLILLLATLNDRPELIKKIRSLDISLLYCEIPHDNSDRVAPQSQSAHPHEVVPYTELCKTARDMLLRNLEALGVPVKWELFYPASISNSSQTRQQSHILFDEDPVNESHRAWIYEIRAWCQPAFYSALLAIIPGLQHLCIHQPEIWDHPLSLQLLSTQFRGLKGVGLCLMALKHLYVPSGFVDAESLDMPALESLEYGLYSKSVSMPMHHRTFGYPLKTLSITCLAIECDYLVFLEASAIYSRLQLLVAQSPALKHVEICLGLVRREEIYPTAFRMLKTGFDVLMSCFAPIAGHLETLTLDYMEIDQPDYLRFVDPMPDLGRYSRLRVLALPCTALSKNFTPQLLPPNLEELDLLDSGFLVTCLIHDLSTHKHWFPKLEYIYVHYNDDNFFPFPSTLRKQLIKANIHCRQLVRGQMIQANGEVMVRPNRSPFASLLARLGLEDPCEQRHRENKIRQFFIDNGGAVTSTMLFSYCSQINICKYDFGEITRLLARRERTVSPRGLWILRNGPADNKVPLLKLPNELLCSIAAYLKPRTTIQDYEGYKYLDRIGKRDVTSAVQKYAQDIQSLQALALVCRKLTPIAQYCLYRSVSLPQAQDETTLDGCLRSPLLLFLRTLEDRPDLAASVTGLDIRAWSTLGIKNVNTTGSVRVSPPTPVPSHISSRVTQHSRIPKNDEKQYMTPISLSEWVERATKIINRLPMTWGDQERWILDAIRIPQTTAFLLILGSLSNLQSLTFGYNTEYIDRLDYLLYRIPIKTLRLGSELTRIRVPHIASLEKLILDYLGDPYFFVYSDLPHVKHLQINCRPEDLFVLTAAAHKKRLKLMLLLRHLPSLKSLRLEPLPFVSGHSFESTGLANLEYLLDISHFSLSAEATFTCLLNTLHPIHKGLQSLHLPPTWWSNIGTIKPITSLRHFGSLRHLSVPKVALTSRYFLHGNVNLAASELPPVLEDLTIFLADPDVCDWVEALFSSREAILKLRVIRMRFRSDLDFVPVDTKFRAAARGTRIKIILEWRDKIMEVIE